MKKQTTRAVRGEPLGVRGRADAIEAVDKGGQPEAALRKLKALDAYGTTVPEKLTQGLNRLVRELSDDLVRELDAIQPSGEETTLAHKRYDALIVRGRPVPELVRELEDRFMMDQAPLVDAMQLLIDRYKGYTLDTFSDNYELARAVNRLARDYGLRLLYKGQPVTVRCVNAPRTRAGSFQVRRAAAGAALLHTSAAFPDLRAAARATVSAAV